MSLRYQLDASALLALLLGERGADVVEPLLDNAQIHAFNLAEVITKLLQKGVPDPEIQIAKLQLDVMEQLSVDQAAMCGHLHAATRTAGLSMGDCICLSMAQDAGLTAITTEREWAAAVRGKHIRIQCIR
ncbi:MAG TPA: PIN domain-containing protein [Bryobacteraceae bacterium]|nr:PIN domain-containing protein [Bryobacteraceae bacterium]